MRGAELPDALRRAAKAGVAVVTVLLILSVPACGITGPNGSAAELCGEGEIGAPPNCEASPPAPAAPGKSWHVAFSEEFNGNDYDRSKLTPCFDFNYGDACTDTFNKGKETYRPEQVRVSDGTAKLVAEPLVPPMPEDACYEDLCTYKAGLLSTARPNADRGGQYLFPFTYGYVETRIKYPAVPGFFTAFWMVPTNPTYEYRTEIDIAEILGGEPDIVYMTYHYDNREQKLRGQQGIGRKRQRCVPGAGLFAGLDKIRRGLAARPHRLVHQRCQVRRVHRRCPDRERAHAAHSPHDDRQHLGTRCGLRSH